MEPHQDHKSSVLLRVSHLPLVHSALQSVSATYSEFKGRYLLLNLLAGVAEVGVRRVSGEAMRQVTPLLQSLEPQMEVANSFAIDGLDRLEKAFPILNESTDQVLAHLKDAFFVTLDDVGVWVVDGLDGAGDQLERVVEAVRRAGGQLQDSQVGQTASLGLDNILTLLEEASAFYMPLPPTLRREWEMRVQEYESEDEEDEPGPWTRVRSLLLTLSLQLYHRGSKVRERLQGAVTTLGGAADQVGLSRVLDLTGELLQYLQNLVVALLFRAESLRGAALRGIVDRATTLAQLRPVRLVRELPAQIQQALRDLQELSKILLQLVVNTTPLYDMLEQPSPQQVEDFLNQEDLASDSSSRRSSANSLFSKGMDGRPRRRRSLYSRASRGSGGPQSPDPTNKRRSSLKDSSNPEVDNQAPPSEGNALRRPSATELLLTPLKQFISQSQKAFEYLSPNSADNLAVAVTTDDM